MTKRPAAAAPTMADIARLAGVSASTVSRALSGSPLVARKKRDLITRLARERGYVVNATARNLRLQRTQTISVTIPMGKDTGQSLADPFFVEMLGHLADEITQRGYSILLQKILPPTEGWLQHLIAANRADGIIVIGQSTEHRVLERAAAHYLPLVVWGAHLERQGYCTVGADNVGGETAATQHLLRAGRRNLIFLGDPVTTEIGLRHEGYRLALQGAPRGSVAAPRMVRALQNADAAYESMRAFIREGTRFDALVAGTDIIAIGAIRALREAGLNVPGDVAVTGFDDIPMAAHTTPPLTTVRQDLARGAHLLVELLMQRIGGAETPSATMPAELVVRESA
jgi:DNA-binding LacI/PurR family transcriptional regulator